MSIEISTAPTSEPVTLTEAKAHMYVDTTDDDTLITTLITSARLYAENFTRRAFITQTITARYDYFPCFFEVEKPPLASVSSINYLDTTGNSTLLAASGYDVDIYATPARITQAYGTTWPSTRADVPNTVTVVYIAGYGVGSAVPETIKQAILMMIGHWYENRESTSQNMTVIDVPMGVESLLMPYVVR